MKNSRAPLTLTTLLFLFACNVDAQNREVVRNVKPFLQNHCIRCHGPDRKEGGVRVDELNWDLEDLDSVEELQNILDEVVVDSMPPRREPRPTENALKEFAESLSRHIENAKQKHRSGGGKPIRRLTKTEYVNTLYDLLGVRVNAEDLPRDGIVGGFDTEALDLYTTDMHLETSLEIARDTARRFIASRNMKPGRVELKKVSKPTLRKGSLVVNASEVPPAGYQVVRLVLWQNRQSQSGPIYVGPRNRQTFEVFGTPEAPQNIDRTFYDSQVESWTANPKVVVGEIQNFQVVNPQPFEFFAKYRKRYQDQVPDKVAPQMLREFVTLMGRGRNVDSRLIKDLQEIFRRGRQRDKSFWEAMVEPMAVSMCTLETMFHFESRGKAAETEFVSPVEMVNRVSYFLWRSAPDAELIRLAQSKKWYDPQVRSEQYRRMMKDEKFQRFLTDFTIQWLELERQDSIAVDNRVFPTFNQTAKESLKEETIQFVSHLIRENLSLGNLIDSDFMMVNNLVAEHYGLPPVAGSAFRPIDVPEGSGRGGLLTQAGILMQTGTGDRTSITERGAFVARKLLNDPPSPPPPLVDELSTEGNLAATLTGPNWSACTQKLPSVRLAIKRLTQSVSAWRNLMGPGFSGPLIQGSIQTLTN
jgi:hypothetical protein